MTKLVAPEGWSLPSQEAAPGRLPKHCLMVSTIDAEPLPGGPECRLSYQDLLDLGLTEHAERFVTMETAQADNPPEYRPHRDKLILRWDARPGIDDFIVNRSPPDPDPPKS